jgi:hypothetical protein
MKYFMQKFMVLTLFLVVATQGTIQTISFETPADKIPNREDSTSNYSQLKKVAQVVGSLGILAILTTIAYYAIHCIFDNVGPKKAVELTLIRNKRAQKR